MTVGLVRVIAVILEGVIVNVVAYVLAKAGTQFPWICLGNRGSGFTIAISALACLVSMATRAKFACMWQWNGSSEDGRLLYQLS